MKSESGKSVEIVHGCDLVLVMDDEDQVRAVARAMLEGLGYIVECTESGLEAVELFQKRKEAGFP